MTQWVGVTVQLNGDQGDVVRSLSRVTAVCRRTRVLSITNEALILEDQWRPHWVRALAVGLFPFGLLALLHRRRGQLVVLTRPAANGLTEASISGEAGGRLTAMMWQGIRQSLPVGSDRELNEWTLPTSRWGQIGRDGKRWARAHPWAFTIGCAVVACALNTVYSPWTIQADVVGNGVFGVLVGGLAARLLGLWPNNRLIHWGRAKLPAIR